MSIPKIHGFHIIADLVNLCHGSTVACRFLSGCSTVACSSHCHGVRLRLDEFVDIELLAIPRLSLTSLVWQDYVSDLACPI